MWLVGRTLYIVENPHFTSRSSLLNYTFFHFLGSTERSCLRDVEDYTIFIKTQKQTPRTKLLY